jgi:hypothetical protein
VQSVGPDDGLTNKAESVPLCTKELCVDGVKKIYIKSKASGKALMQGK